MGVLHRGAGWHPQPLGRCQSPGLHHALPRGTPACSRQPGLAHGVPLCHCVKPVSSLPLLYSALQVRQEHVKLLAEEYLSVSVSVRVCVNQLIGVFEGASLCVPGGGCEVWAGEGPGDAHRLTSHWTVPAPSR